MSIFPVTVNSLDFYVMSMFPVRADAFEAKTKRDRESGLPVPKLAIDGSPLFGARALEAVELDDLGTPTGKASNTFFSVKRPIDVVPGSLYRLTGPYTITPFVTDKNRLGVSVVAESLEVVGDE